MPKAKSVLRDMFNERRKGFEKKPKKKKATNPKTYFVYQEIIFFKFLCVFKIMPVVELFLKAVFI